MGNISGLAITSMILGIVSLFLIFIPILGQLLPIVAIVLGIIGLRNINQDNTLSGKGMSIAGIVVGAVALVISVIIIVGMVALFNVIRSSNITQNITR